MSMLTDIFAWYLTRETPAFAYLLVVSGGLLGMSLNFQIGLSLYQMWLPFEWDRRISLGLINVASLSKKVACASFTQIKALVSNANTLAVELSHSEQMQKFQHELKRAIANIVGSVKNRLLCPGRRF